MALSFFVIFILALIHFIYEAIVLPSYRLQLRYKLFALRDELRFLKIDHGSNISKQEFEIASSTVNTPINHLALFKLSLFYSARQTMNSDKEFKTLLDEREEVLDNSKIERLKEICNEATLISLKALTANSGMVLFYLFPLVLVIYVIRRALSVYSNFVDSIKKLTLTSDDEFKQFLNPSDRAAVYLKTSF